MPVIGGYFEKMNIDKSKYNQTGKVNVIEYQDTGGDIIYGNIGLNLYYKSVKLFALYQKKMYNQLNGYTQLVTKYKINVGLTYNF